MSYKLMFFIIFAKNNTDMKNLILLCLFFFQINIVLAQSLTVTGNNTANPQGNDPCLPSGTSTITVKNISSNTLNVLCEKVVLQPGPSGTWNYFCWGGNCYPSTTIVSTDYTTLAPGEGSPPAEFGGYFEANCSTGVSVVQYNFYPDNDPTDITSITITFNDGVTSISEGKADYSIKGFFPNPAQDYTTINYNIKDNSNLVVFDILGNEVKNILLPNSNVKEIYVGDLKQGIYFANLMSNEKVIDVKKLIVK